MKKRNIFILIMLWGVLLFNPYLWVGSLQASPDQSLEKLLEGNKRFVSGQVLHPHQDKKHRLDLLKGQKPFAAILGCADSRVSPELIFDQGLGDLFSIRVAGNTPDDFVMGSLEYGVSVLKIPLIIVLGHEKCGAVEAALSKKTFPGHIEAIAQSIRPALQIKKCQSKNKLSCAVQDNVDFVVKKIKSSQPILAPLIQSGQVQVLGASYDLKSGRVQFMKHDGF